MVNQRVALLFFPNAFDGELLFSGNVSDNVSFLQSRIIWKLKHPLGLSQYFADSLSFCITDFDVVCYGGKPIKKCIPECLAYAFKTCHSLVLRFVMAR